MNLEKSGLGSGKKVYKGMEALLGLSPKTSSRLSMTGALYGDKGVG